MCAAEVALEVLLCVPTLLVAHHHDLFAVDLGEAAYQGLVVGEVPIAVYLDKVIP
jgi:hypothetical protein